MTGDVKTVSAGRLIRNALFAALLGTLLFATGLIFETRQAFYSYLAAYAFGVSIATGALIFLMTVHLMGATWPVALRRLIEAIAGTAPLFALLVAPVLLGLDQLYPWTTPSALAEPVRRLVEAKQSYLNPGFFVLRTLVYVTVWSFASVLLCRWSFRQDLDPLRTNGQRPRVISGVALPLVGFTLTFAAIDWLMSLTPTWWSTMYGLYYFGGAFVGALATLILVTIACEHAQLLPPLRSSHYYALGRLLLAAVALWGYFGFFQLLLIWIAGKPIEASWYLLRLRGGWTSATVVLACGHFVLPFIVLLSYRLKQSRLLLGIVAGWLLVFHYFDVYWLVLPTLHQEGARPHWLDIGTLLIIAGTSLAMGTWLLRGRAAVPLKDPALAAALRYGSR